jgi:hypothetical protein
LLFVDHFPLERNPWDSIYVNQRVAKPLPARGCNQAAHWRPLPPTHPSCFAGLSSFPVSRMVFRRTSHLRGKHRRLDALSLEDHAHYHTFRKSEPEFLMHTAKKMEPLNFENLPPHLTHHKLFAGLLRSWPCVSSWPLWVSAALPGYPPLNTQDYFGTWMTILH